MANQVFISSSTNQVSINQEDRIVTITEPISSTIEVKTGPQGARGSVGAPGASNPLDEYVFVLDTNNGFTLTGSAAPQSTIVVTDMEGNTFRHTPTEFDFPNANEMFVEGNTIWVGYNWAFRIYDSSSLESTYKLVRLEDVVVDFSSSTLSYNVAENIYLTSGSQNFSQAHGNDMSENYIFLTSRGSNGDNNNTGFQVARINKYDFTDIQLYQTPVNSDFGDGEVCRYYNGNLYVGCNDGYTRLKISRFNAFDLYDNELLITGPSNRIGPPGVLEIYKNQIFTTTDYRKSGVDLLKYDLNGNLLAQNRIYPITGSGEYFYEFNVPHASTIKDNHWYITQIYSYASVLKVDIDTLELVDSIALEADKQASPTDDITIGQDGNLWIGTEDNEFVPADERALPKIYKVTTDNLEVTEIATLNKSSFGSFSIKNQTLRDQYKPFTYNFNGTYVGDLITSGSITSTDGFTGSLEGTASFATTASYAYSASYEIIQEVTSSYAETASYVNPLVQDVIVTGSLTVSGSSTFTNIGPAVFSGSVTTTEQRITLDPSNVSGSLVIGTPPQDTGSYSLAIGRNALANFTGSDESGFDDSSQTAFGYAALSMSNQTPNDAFGMNALEYLGSDPETTSLYTPQYNTGFGTAAGRKWQGYASVFIGQYAGPYFYNSYGNYNVGIGPLSLYQLSGSTRSSENMALGGASFYQMYQGTGNTGVGPYSFFRLTNGNNNTGIGRRSWFSLTTGSNNIAIGSQVTGVTTANNNIIIGTLNNLGLGNTLEGNFILTTPTSILFRHTGSISTFYSDLTTSGSITTTEPRITLDSLNESGSLLIGRPSQALDPGFGYLAAGVDSLVSIISASDTDGASVAFGDYALSQSTDGPNTAFGYGALQYLGSDDQFWGINGQGPFYNTAVGAKSAYKWLGNTSTFIGEFSGPYFNYAYGRYNVGIGAQSLLRLSGSSTDDINENSAVGIGSLIDLRQGNNNIAFGTLSAQKLQFGNNNIVIGSKLLDLTSGSNNLIIGSLNTLGLGNIDNNIIFTDNSAIRYRFDGTDTTIYSDLTTSGSITSTGQRITLDTLDESGSIIIGKPLFSTGSLSLAIGRNALINFTGSDDPEGGQTAVGVNALSSSIYAPNDAFGNDALRNLGSDPDSTPYDSNSPLYNAAFGTAAGKTWQGGLSTWIGSYAGPYFNKAYGNFNVGIGTNALAALSGSVRSNQNVAVGGSTLRNLIQGEYNTALGTVSLFSLERGNNNTSIGRYSGGSLKTGSNNIILGSRAIGLVTGSDNVIIGSLDSIGTGNIDNNIIFTDNSTIRYRFDGTDTTIYSDLVTSGSVVIPDENKLFIGTGSFTTDKNQIIKLSDDVNGGLEIIRSNNVQKLRLGYGSITAQSQGLSLRGDAVNLNLNSSLSSGNAFSFTRTGGRRLTDTDAEQSWIKVEPDIGQSGTANYVGLLMDITETSLGSGTNYLADFRVGGTSRFSITNSGSVSMDGILTLTPQSPLPSGVATGSFAVSASVPPKPYFFDGSNWNALY